MDVGRPAQLTSSQHARFERDGAVILREFTNATVTSAILEGAVGLARREQVESGAGRDRPFVLPEANLSNVEVTAPEQAVSKVFRVHREEPFR
ncbi:MAG TPA: hypothetical protein VK771_05150, partial [Acidimicrobiia bacterium]|nr:hypothetical protein [Acidimicrobiia bacterium]